VQFSIRNYRPEDFEALLALDQTCFAPGIAYSAFELRTYINRKSAFTSIAELPEEMRAKGDEHTPGAAIVGFIVVERGRGMGHIITIDVRTEVRRHGVGSLLLKSAEDQLRTFGCVAARLETAVDNIGALSFYKRHGYHVIKTIPHYYSTGVDALLLEKHLLSPPSTS
jgi:ribosomal-protein-alanine N-acetyltransferase